VSRQSHHREHLKALQQFVTHIMNGLTCNTRHATKLRIVGWPIHICEVVWHDIIKKLRISTDGLSYRWSKKCSYINHGCNPIIHQFSTISSWKVDVCKFVWNFQSFILVKFLISNHKDCYLQSFHLYNGVINIIFNTVRLTTTAAYRNWETLPSNYFNYLKACGRASKQ
jgi:hypothetical protein